MTPQQKLLLDALAASQTELTRLGLAVGISLAELSKAAAALVANQSKILNQSTAMAGSILQLRNALAGNTPANPAPTPNPAPGAFSVSATPANTQVTLNWTTSLGSQGYQPQSSPSGAIGSWTPLTAIFLPAADRTYTATGLVNGTQRFYRIMSGNGFGNDTASNIVAATPAGGTVTPPPTLTGFVLQALPGRTAIALAWNPQAGGPSYQVQKSLDFGVSWNNMGAAQTATAFNDQLVVPGEPYQYRITTPGGNSNTVLIAGEDTESDDLFVSTPTNFKGFCTGSRSNFLTWRKGNYRDKQSYEIEFSTNGGTNWNPLVTISPVACVRGIYDINDPAEIRRIDSYRNHEHNIAGGSGNTSYRIRAVSGSLFFSPWSTTLTIVRQGAVVAATPATLKSVYDAQAAGSGNVVAVSAGSINAGNPERITFKPGVSIQSTGLCVVNFTGQDAYSWKSAYMGFESGTQTDMNLIIEGIEVNGGPTYQGRSGISCERSNMLWVRNCRFVKTFRTGTNLNAEANDCVFLNNYYEQAGYSPSEPGDAWEGQPGEGSGFVGAWNAVALTRNIQVIGNTVNSTTKGYGFKHLPDYTQKYPLSLQYLGEDPNDAWFGQCFDMLISGNSVTMGNRLWQNASPQFAIELYTVESMNCQIYENFMVNQISLEARNRVHMSSRYNVRVSQNHIDLRYKDAVEMSNHKLWIERNVCDFRNNLNTQACFSDSNTPPPGSLFNTDDSIVENNLCLGSNDTPCFLMLRNRFRRLKVRNNTIPNPVAGSDYAFFNLPSRDNGTDNNTPTDLLNANNVIAADSGVNRTWLIRSTRDDGGGFKPNLSGATPTVLGFFRRWGNISTRTYNNVNATSMADAGNSFGVQPQFAGGSDIRRMYRPLLNGNLDKTGIRVGISHAGTAPNRGCY